METQRPSLTIIGDVCVDITMGTIGEWPAVGTETLMDEHELRPGGSAGNSALAMQYLGSDCTLVSLVGDNHFGDWLAGCFGHCKSRLGVCNAPTTLSVCLTHSCSERTIFTTRGHLEQMTANHALEGLEPARIAGDTVLLTGAFLLPRLRAGYRTVLERIAEAGYDIAIDTGWPSGGWTNATRDEVLGWLSHCNHLLLNESEALGLAGETDLENASRFICGHLPASSCLVIKRGRRGALAVQDGAAVTAGTAEVEVRDSIGAGDTFNAGYLDTRLRGADLKTAIETACTLASTVISQPSRIAIGAGDLSGIAWREAQTG